ncbi:GH25 family lysozyme [Bifidobacterium gallicum]|nr:GH25 family lysozyme [Bifidobacterium gallicum]KFI59372.1 putative S-layer domain protein [Bifidobacterium gallicum DSM 20093 = LMG 11596]
MRHAQDSRHSLKFSTVVGAIAALAMTATFGTPLALAEESSLSNETSAMVTADVPPNPTHMWSGATQDGEPAPRFYSARGFTDRPNWEADANGKRVVRQGNGQVFSADAMKVIDVSEHQEAVDWTKVVRSGVDGAVLRLGYGIENDDVRFAQNLQGVRKVGLPFGVYLYSYAYDAQFAREEANYVADVMDRYGIRDNMLPIFYDLEEWTWTGHRHPTTAAQYKPIVDAFFNTLAKRGYTHVQVYSYMDYLNHELNDPSIRARTGWVAQYKPNFDYAYPSSYQGSRGWQYTDAGDVWGITGAVDASAFDRYVFRDVNMHSTAHAADIDWMRANGTTTGYGDLTYRPASTVVRQDMAAFLYRVAGSPAFTPTAAQKQRFKDVGAGTPHAREIWWLAASGITTGFDDGSYRPMNHVNRQDMAAFLYRLAGSPAYTPSAAEQTRFADVNASTPHAKEIWWCAANGIATGFADGTYRPTNTVIRQDMAAFLHRAAIYNGHA